MTRPRSRIPRLGAALATAGVALGLARVLSRRAPGPGEALPIDAVPAGGSPDPAPPPPQGDGADTITRNTAFALASQIATATFTAILTIVLVRVLGPEDYGVFALAISVASLVFLPADFGISQSTARFVAERRGDRGLVAEVMADGLKLKAAASGFISNVSS